LFSFDIARRLAPSHPESLFNYASVALELGRMQEAIALLPQLRRMEATLAKELSREIDKAKAAKVQQSIPSAEE